MSWCRACRIKARWKLCWCIVVITLALPVSTIVANLYFLLVVFRGCVFLGTCYTCSWKHYPRKLDLRRMPFSSAWGLGTPQGKHHLSHNEIADRSSLYHVTSRISIDNEQLFANDHPCHMFSLHSLKTFETTLASYVNMA